MIQPFERLTEGYLSRLETMNKTFLVTQSYPNGSTEATQSSIIVSVYDNPGLAKTHWNAVKCDPLAAIVDLNNQLHREKIIAMLRGKTFLIYWAVVKDAKDVTRRINAKYNGHMRRYIEKYTDWKISRESHITAVIELIFGEMYVTLKHRSQRLRIKLDEIERQVETS